MPLIARLACLGFLLAAALPLAAQPADSSAAVLGVVWRQPDDLGAALRDLRAMRDAGVQAVRTDLVTRASVLRTADILGLAVYQDLDVADLPAARLADTLAYARRELQAALDLAQRHPSVRAFGLGHFADTSTPTACSYFQFLADLVRSEGGAGMQTYYLTRFVEDDACGGAVDFVLLDARGHNPAWLVRRWRAAHDTPVGIGAFGAAVDDGVAGGYLMPRSPAAQARFIENGLGALAALEPSPAAVFLFRWRDGVEAPYGLLDAEDRARPAFGVVQGFYTGRQRVFAINAGAEPVAREDAPTFVLLGWLVTILVALLLWLAPRFRQLAPRYFTRHAYYRESLQRGRGVEGWASLGLAVAVALAAGITGAVVLHAAADTDVLEAVVGGLEPLTQARVLRVLAAPLLAGLLVGLAYVLWLLFNMLWLFALTGRKHRIRPVQALTLTVWSRWPLLILMLVAVLVAVQPEASVRWVPLLLALWLAVEFVAGVRMLFDFGRVTRVPILRAVGLGLIVPLGLLVVLGLGLLVAVQPELAFLWSLSTKQ